MLLMRPILRISSLRWATMAEAIMSWHFQALKHYVDFSGRARRAEYWWFVLPFFITSFVLGFIDGFIGTVDAFTGLGLLSTIYVLALLLPGVTVGMRRMHDVGRSGWWQLVPIVGFVFAVTDSTVGTNQYGEDPKLRAVTEAGLIRSIERRVIEIAREGTGYERWTVGITDDPGRSKAEQGNPLGWRSWRADSEPTARRVEQGFRDKGMKGSPGGGAAPIYVYIF